MRALLAGFALLAALLAAAPASAQVVITEPWVRATVEGQSSTGAYMRIKSDVDVRLIAAESPLAASVSVHEMQLKQNVMSMRSVDALEIPARREVALEEGHWHLMLQGLKRPLKPGERVPLRLLFVDAKGMKQAVHAEAPVRALGAVDPAPPHRHEAMKATH